ncbi:MAG TPA: solute carrier family 23 protein [Thermodesulfobacteriota bacterium]|nr:solute carrier family 23 protein [Thermodesulfobacteriota bacterium]
MAQESFLYQLDENPPFHKNLIYGLQWVMTSIPSVAFFATLCGVALGLDPQAQISFSQRLLIVTGLITMLQSLFGHRYPVLEGPSSAILVTFMVLAPHGGLPAIEGGTIAGGLFLMLIGGFKWLKRLSSLFTPHVVGVILVLVALTLLSFIYPLLIGVSKASPHGELGIFGYSLLIILLVSFMSHRLRGFLQTTSMLAGILFGLVLFLLKGGISFSLVSQSSWFALPSPLLGVWPSFSLPAILAIVCTYLAVMVNSLGSIQGISEVVGTEDLENRIHRGIGMTGVGGVIAGCLGVSGLVSLSISPGIVLVTRVASRYALTMSGAIMILCAFIPKLWALLTAVPPSVIGSVLLVVLSSQLLVGINIMLPGKGTIERRDYFTIGLPILIGAMISIIPKEFFQLFPNIIASLVGNGLVMGILFSLLLEHVLFRQRKENR